MTAEIIFWASLGLVVYSYFLYPFLVAGLVSLRGAKPVVTDDRARPTVSLVISFYNEEGVLPQKLLSLSSISYPQEKIEFIIGSDGSTDKTNELLAAWDHPCKKVLVFDKRKGKAPVLNDLVAGATGEIVVFSDANTLFVRETVLNLVRRFADSQVGAVCGELVLRPEGAEPSGMGETSYWTFENWLKRLESDYRTLLGATGGVYAIRRALFVPLPVTKSVTDDFLIPLHIVRKGYRVIYARDALAYERTSGSMKGEFRRKARIGAQNFASIAEFAPLLSPRAGFVAFALWSHKMIRWFVPFFAGAAVAASAILAENSLFYACALFVELGFFAVAAAGMAAERARIPLGRFSLPYYITAMNVALLVGFMRFVTRKQRTTWEVLR